MKPISKKEYDKVVELSANLESHIDNGFLKMVEDGEEVNLNFQVGSTHYKTIVRDDEGLTVTSDYIDEDGMVYEDEEMYLNEQPLHIKLMFYWQIVKKTK